MYNVLIAEDSRPILRNIRHLLEISGLPVQVAAVAHNGEEALEKLAERHIHIVLTDIRMPKLDGLELIGHIKQRYPWIKVVLISGYSDFEYTRKALNYQVFDYLLKPVEGPDLKDVLERLLAQLEQSDGAEHRVLADIAPDGFYWHSGWSSGFGQCAKVPFVLRKRPLSGGGASWSPEALQSVCEAFFQPYRCWTVPTRNEQELLLLADAAVLKEHPAVLGLMERLRARLDEAGHRTVMAARSSGVSAADAGKAYLRLSALLDSGLTTAGGLLLDQGHSLSGQEQAGSSGFEELLASLTGMIRQRQQESFSLKLSERLAQWESEGVRIALLERLVSSLADAFAVELSESGLWERLLQEGRVRSLAEYESFGAFGSGLLEWTESCFGRLQAGSRTSGDALFQSIDAYLRRRLYSQVTIADLAGEFHISPSYVSRIMRRCAGTTFVQHYMELKIEEACRLLTERPELKIGEIAEALAFSDQHYFSKVFKEYRGCSPSEYRERKVSPEESG